MVRVWGLAYTRLSNPRCRDDPDIRVHDNTIVVTYYNAPMPTKPTPSVPPWIRSIGLEAFTPNSKKKQGVEKTKGPGVS